MRNPLMLTEMDVRTDPTPPSVGSAAAASHATLRDCFELFHSTVTGIAKLSIETSNDLFELDSHVTTEQVFEFKSKRTEWLEKFDAVLWELFDKRLAGKRRKGRRPDPVQSFESLSVMSDNDTSSQNALKQVTKRLAEAATTELEALDHRVSVLFDDARYQELDNPFSPEYLVDAIGVTSRAVYTNARIWRLLMWRVVGEFVPAISKIYLQINRYLAERSVLPDIGPALRARSALRPDDDNQLVPLFSRLINDVDPGKQAWRTLDRLAASSAGYGLAPLDENPYEGATEHAPQRPGTGAPGDFPRLNAMLMTGTLSTVLETLDHWQRADPLAEYLRSHAQARIDAEATPVNRIPWIHAAIASRVPDESTRTAIDVVGFVFDYIFRDPSLPPRFRVILGGLQVPMLKVALTEPGFFADASHPARRLIDGLAAAAIGTDDDQAYGQAFEVVAKAIVDTICTRFVLDVTVLERECGALEKFADEWQAKSAVAMQRPVNAALTGEWRDAHRSRVRVLIRDKLAGVDVPLDVRGFIGTVWAEHMTLLRQAGGIEGDDYAEAVKIMDDMLWSIAIKERKGQKARLAKIIPSLVQKLRAGGTAVRASDEKMKRFLSALYDLHIAAIKPGAAKASGVPRFVAPSFTMCKQIGNLHDFVSDLVIGTWLAFDRKGIPVHLRLSWVSPWRSTYVFASPSGSTLMALTPEELAWEMSAGKVTLVVEPVPLFDRAISVTLEYLAAQRQERPTPP